MLGWVCLYTPEEIFAAMGITSRRLWGEGGRAAAAQRLLPVNLCPLVRACLGEGLGGDQALSGAVLTTSCHAMVHLANALHETRGGRFFVHLLDLPRTFGRRDEAAGLVFAASLRDLAGRLSGFYGAARDDDALWEAIAVQRQVRWLLRDIYRLRRERPELFRAAGLMELVRRAGATRKEELIPVLRDLVALLREERDGGPAAAPLLGRLRRRGPARGPRLLVTGSPLPPAYLDLIEDLGANVAGDDLCHSYRYALPEVAGDAGGDPFLALARGYLGRPPCPCMLAGPERSAHLQALARECRAQGVIYHALKFCDASLYEHTMLRSAWPQAGVPLLYLETEYREAGLEQARTRIQAFLERLSTASF